MFGITILALASSTYSCPAATALAQKGSMLLQAQTQVCATMADRFDSVQLSLIASTNITEQVLLSENEVALQVGTSHAGRLPVTATWVNTQRMEQKAVLWFRVYGPTSTWVYAKDMQAESVIYPTDMYKTTVDLAVLDLRKSQLPPIEGAWALNLARRKGQVIQMEHLREPALVKRQQKVRLVYRQLGLEISTQAVALSNGWRLNDEVKVKITGAVDVITAKVAAKEEVYVEI